MPEKNSAIAIYDIIVAVQYRVLYSSSSELYSILFFIMLSLIINAVWKNTYSNGANDISVIAIDLKIDWLNACVIA